jgi:CRISPR/Cas system-associated exonuclease Cas4 (RecB family)
LFETGKREEPRLIENLKNIGIKISEIDEETGEQHTVSFLGGHFGGSLDGIGSGFEEAPKTQHVVEFKTRSDNSYRKLVSGGVEKASPEHYAQMQIYMFLSGIDRAMYICVNKNTDEVYTERVSLEVTTAEALLEKAERIVFASTPAPKISDSPTSFHCKWCSFKTFCHGTDRPQMNCRTCLHATPNPAGGWICEHHDKQLSVADQLAGCEDHLFIPDLLSLGEPVNASPDEITYRDISGSKIINKKGGLLVVESNAKNTKATPF